MNPVIEPYQFATLKRISKHLINTYKTVSDAQTIAVTQMQTLDKIDQLFPQPTDEIKHFLLQLMDKTMTFAQLEFSLATLKRQVIAFPIVSDTVLSQQFKKIKKPVYPNWEQIELTEATYISWQDIATNRKYLLTKIDDQFVGVVGTQSSIPVKNSCAICQQVASVSLFVAQTKSGSEGTYTKQGNYICLDPKHCNQHIEEKTSITRFFQTVRPK